MDFFVLRSLFLKKRKERKLFHFARFSGFGFLLILWVGRIKEKLKELLVVPNARMETKTNLPSNQQRFDELSSYMLQSLFNMYSLLC
jgi:hypothetical protein